MPLETVPLGKTEDGTTIVETDYPLGGFCECGGEIDHVDEEDMESDGALHVRDWYACKSCEKEYFVHWTAPLGSWPTNVQP